MGKSLGRKMKKKKPYYIYFLDNPKQVNVLFKQILDHPWQTDFVWSITLSS